MSFVFIRVHKLSLQVFTTLHQQLEKFPLRFGDFFTSKTLTLNAPLGALNEFCGSKMPLLKGLTCYECKTRPTILIHELRAVSWKYTCLRTMDFICHV